MRVKVRDLKNGMTVYECERGMSIELTAQEDAQRVQEGLENGHSCHCKSSHGDVWLFQTIEEAQHHYGPHLYKTPQY